MLFRRNRRRSANRGPVAAQRRGVVLLVVLMLLALFIIISTTFLLVATHYNRGAQSQARQELILDPPQKLLDTAFYQLVRGTQDPRSAIRGHDLLGDLYGLDGFSGLVQSANVTTANLPNITVSLYGDARLQWINMGTTGGQVVLSDDNHIDFWAGCVLSFVSGPMRGTSCRILSSNIELNTAPPRVDFIVRLPENATSTVGPNVDDRVVVNGRPFNGPGFAYDQGTQQLRPEALVPNWTGIPMDPAAGLSFRRYLYGVNGAGQTLGPSRTSGPDEGYDAPDYQNMALAAILPDPTNPNLVGAVIPSFLRPSLINYARLNSSTVSVLPMTEERMTMRPVFVPSAANPNVPDYTRSTASEAFPMTDLVRGPWDIDNDNDGIPDSVWVDIGLPDITAKNGRTRRPLVAYLCLDMDGKLNLNYHGSRSHTFVGYDQNVSAQAPAVAAGALARGQTLTALPKGSGWGPADINLFYLFWDETVNNANIAAARYANSLLLHGVPNSIAGRYGFPAGGFPEPGTQLTDLLTTVKYSGYPGNYFANQVTQFSTPLDLRGELAFGLDPRGALLTEIPGNFAMQPDLTDIMTNNPYEVHASGTRGEHYTNVAAPADQLYSVAELEAILRRGDWDAPTLPSRLLRIFDGTRQLNADIDNDGNPDTVPVNFQMDNPRASRMITTESWELPVPNILLRSQVPGRQGSFQSHIVSELYGRIKQNVLGAQAPTQQFIDFANEQIRRMLGHEIRDARPNLDLRRGLRLNLNTPFGDGLDNNGNGIVDEFPESVAFDSQLTRRELARQLYVLAMLLKDPAADIGIDLNGDGATNGIDTAFYLAQWAVNVVDYRDADSIMTHFEFDTNPFNGWEVDDNPITTELPDPNVINNIRGVIWGCERPELLISENFAFHDRRTENLNTGGGQAPDDDDDYDQRLIPQSGFFVELYNPWAGNDDRKPPELYSTRTVNGVPQMGVDLERQAPDGSPVWRLVVATYEANDPRDDVPDPDIQATGSIERQVYFVRRNALPNTLANRQDVYARSVNTPDISLLAPGRFGVIGTGRYNINGEYVTPIGRRSDYTVGMPNDEAARHIMLRPNQDANVHQVQVRNNSQQDVVPANMGASVTPPAPVAGEPFPAEPPAADRAPAMAVVIDSPQLSVSEPVGGYAAMADALEQVIGGPLDSPLDFDRGADGEAIVRTRAGATSTPYRLVYLQRLADPLRPFDPVSNPYRTVDGAQVFVNAINGLASNQQQEAADTTRVGSDGQPIVEFDPSLVFRSIQRGDTDPDSAQDRGRALWPQLKLPNLGIYPPSQSETPQVHNFNYYLIHSLGYLNTNYWPYFGAAGGIYRGAPDTSNPLQGHPFPWMKWNNRPYINPYELLQVPFSSQFGLLRDYALNIPNILPSTEYDTNAPSGVFGHLPRFLASQDTGTGSFHMYRLLEYTRTPSPFLDTEEYVAGASLSNYREPGRVNLNTIYDPRVWRAILNGHPGPSFSDLMDSRRGYGTAGQGMILGNNLYIDNDHPTIFANPFRPPYSGDFAPSNYAGGERDDIQATLLRGENIMGQNPTGEPWLLDAAITQNNNAHNDARRNPQFYYETAQRLGNLVTTHSNVYAIWITVGYFEVDPGTGLVGQEVGADTGEVQRHRAFYIFDRSIPVAYEPGENHNVDQAVLLRRFIE